jgi:hypothetical protein
MLHLVRGLYEISASVKALGLTFECIVTYDVTHYRDDLEVISIEVQSVTDGTTKVDLPHIVQLNYSELDDREQIDLWDRCNQDYVERQQEASEQRYEMEREQV